MKVRSALRAFLLSIIICFSTTVFAEYYVVMGGYMDYFPHYRHHLRHRTLIHHYVHKRYHYFDWWAYKHRHCYDPDLTTGDDDPCIYPDMDIDE